MKIVIIDYGAGNIQSVQFAIKRLGFEAILSKNPIEIQQADKVIFPGVGEASSAMQHLEEKGLDKVIKELTQPFLGICLGMQLMCESSEEGDTKGLGIFDAKVLKFPPTDLVPQMGWNNFTALKGELFENIQLENDCYFVHSYYAEICPETIAVTDYILPFSAALHKNNFYLKGV